MSGLNYQICLVYLDDVIVFSRTVAEHFERLELLFGRLREANLKLKPSKCHLFRKAVTFLGHIVSETGLETDPEKISCVKEWPVPSTVTEVRSFVGLASYYRRFVKDFSELASPLHELTKKNAQFYWNEDCQKSFEELKLRLISSPILAMPRDEGKYFLDTDASGRAIGAVLSQEQDGQERVIAYASRMLSGPERNYCVTRQELLAIVYFVKQLRPYLLGHQFVIRTDHSALRWLRSTPEPIGQQARWLEVLEEFNYQVEHRPGRKHNNADALSRMPCRQCHRDEYEITQVTARSLHLSDSGDGGVFDPINLAREYEQDPELATIYQLRKDREDQVPWSEVVGADKFTKAYWLVWDRLRVFNGVLFRHWESLDGMHQRWQMIPPTSVREELVRLAHTGMNGGHLGVKRTSAQLQLRAYWVGWSNSVANYCARCPECSQYHCGNPPRHGRLQPMVVGEPFEKLAIDLTGPHPTSRSGNVFILTVVDVFSKFAEALPLRNKEAVTVARALVDVVITRYGVPLQILSDNGREFENNLLHEICNLLGIDKIKTTAYKASTNGVVERFHRTLNSMLGKVVSSSQRDWDERLPAVMAAYRASKHESTGFTPNFLIFGTELRAPMDLLYDVPSDENEQSYDTYASEKVVKMREAYRLVREHLGNSAERNKQYYDMRVRPQKYSVGTWVYYYSPRRYVGKSPKWQRCYSGPYLVVKVMDPVNVILQLSRRSQPFVTHIDKVNTCSGSTPASWLVDEPEVLANEMESIGPSVEELVQHFPVEENVMVEPVLSSLVSQEHTVVKDLKAREETAVKVVDKTPEVGRPQRVHKKPVYLNEYV